MCVPVSVYVCAHPQPTVAGKCVYLSIYVYVSGSYKPLCVLHIIARVYSPRYNSEGHVTNITLPTGEVSGFHGNLERWSRVEVEASNRENFVTSTNLSASDTIYTFRQGMQA